MTAGWLSDCDVPTLARPGKLIFDAYGMSFSARVADRLEALDPGLPISASVGQLHPLITAMLASSVAFDWVSNVHQSRSWVFLHQAFHGWIRWAVSQPVSM